VPPAPYTIKTTEISVAHNDEESVCSDYIVFYITLDEAASAGTIIDLKWG
jgi:hypothetical protein